MDHQGRKQIAQTATFFVQNTVNAMLFLSVCEEDIVAHEHTYFFVMPLVQSAGSRRESFLSSTNHECSKITPYQQNIE